VIAPPADRAYDLLAMGRSGIDLYAHEIGVPITGVKSFDAYVGGCPTNVSVGARRLGLRTALLTAVGEDQVGAFVLHFLEREGVETRFIPRKPGRRTSAVILTIQPPDHFPLTFYRDNCADIALTVDDVLAAPVAESRVLFLTGTGLSREPSHTATLAAAEVARRAGTAVVFDIDYRPDQWPDVRTFGAAVRSALGLADVAIGTEEEVCAAAGLPDVDAAAARLAECPLPALVLKRGPHGARVYQRGGAMVDVAPFPVEVLNVLGAGDAFASGLLYAWLHGWPLERAARFGNATGAIVVTRHACANDMPTLGEVEAFAAAHGGW
jgi:5-dehydro-2-deoxygluconokinase